MSFYLLHKKSTVDLLHKKSMVDLLHKQKK